MNKLKENAFALAVAGVAVVILAMLYLLVYQPLSALGQRESELDAEIAKLKRFNDRKKTPDVPTKALENALKERAETIQQSLDEGLKSYDERVAAFRQYFGDSTSRPESGAFVGSYDDAIETATKTYQEKFGITPDPNAPTKVPDIKRVSLTGADEKKIDEAMREYWMAKEIVDACIDLGIAGLLEIGFGGRSVDKQKNPYFRPVFASVKVEMPFSQIENFLTKLYTSKRVPFVLQGLEAARKPESMGAYQSLEKAAAFKSLEEAKSKTYAQLAPEPNLVVDMKLYAVDWVGAQAAPAGDAKTQPGKEETPEK